MSAPHQYLVGKRVTVNFARGLSLSISIIKAIFMI
jgi:hypothetical protein